ncbi:MAG: HupE/UreJ family protein [Acidimicrobiales bacterium]
MTAPHHVGRTAERFRALALAWMFAVVSLGLLAIGVLSPSPADAHTTEDPYLYLFVTETQLDGRVELSVADLEVVLDRKFASDDPTIKLELDAAADQIRRYAADHVSIGLTDSADAQWPITFGDVELFRERDDLAFAVIPYVVAVPDELQELPTDLAVKFDAFFDDIGDRNGLLLINGGWTAGAYDRDAESLVTFSDDSRQQQIQLGDRTQWQNFVSSISLGIDHIRTGPDHIMFVLALLLPSVLVFSAGWHPVAGFLSALWRVLKIATFFTLAHSITFTLAGMGWLPLPPSKIVESIIALSIAAAALHNLRPIFPNREWALSFVFGLFHGMGFASLVAELEVSRTSQLVSLIGRNVGIEIGQVIVILVAFPMLFLLRRTSWYEPVLTIGSILLAVLSLSWMVERIFEVDLGTDTIVESVVSLPRGYIIAAVLTAVAFGIHRTQAQRNQLLPVYTKPTPQPIGEPVGQPSG